MWMAVAAVHAPPWICSGPVPTGDGADWNGRRKSPTDLLVRFKVKAVIVAAGATTPSEFDGIGHGEGAGPDGSDQQRDRERDRYDDAKRHHGVGQLRSQAA